MTNLNEIFNTQRVKTRTETPPTYEERRATLTKLIDLIQQHENDICEAMHQDFGNRCKVESMLGDIITALGGLKNDRRHLKKWMKPKKVKTTLQYLPGSSHIEYQPLGVVGIIAPWNYPFLLAISPAAQALAAGNRVMLKPSEFTPNISALLAKMINENFDPDYFTVITGDSQVGIEFSKQPFDHLFFTGSTQIGRMVALAAAANLTPVTLELGGKSPVIFSDNLNLQKLIPRMAFGKFLNGGQTCIAPDYAFVKKQNQDEFVEILQKTIKSFFPDGTNSSDYTSIINDRNYQRLNLLLEDAEAKGAKIIQIGDQESQSPHNSRQFPPTIILNVTDEMAIMQQEIFGPILPIMTYDNIDQAIKYINDHERPLSLYYFGDNKQEQRLLLDKTVSGGVSINDVLWHIVQDNLPFGGVGASGMGAYHGQHGFKTFSHQKAVFTQSKFSTLFLLFPPYGKIVKSIIKLVKMIL